MFLLPFRSTQRRGTRCVTGIVRASIPCACAGGLKIQNDTFRTGSAQNSIGVRGKKSGKARCSLMFPWGTWTSHIGLQFPERSELSPHIHPDGQTRSLAQQKWNLHVRPLIFIYMAKSLGKVVVSNACYGGAVHERHDLA